MATQNNEEARTSNGQRIASTTGTFEHTMENEVEGHDQAIEQGIHSSRENLQDEANVNLGARIIQSGSHTNRLAQAIQEEQTSNREDSYRGAMEDREEARITISENDILTRLREFKKDIYTYDETISLYDNKEKAKNIIAEMGNYLRPFGELTPDILAMVKTININNIKPPRNSILIDSLLAAKISPEKISGKKYMSIFKAQKYLLNIHPDIGEITNFFHVVDKNDASTLLKSFKDNKQALINIVIGLIKITFAYKEVLIKYDYTYDLIYKDQLFENVVFDFDSYTTYGDYNFLKKIQNGENETVIKIRLTVEDFKKSNLIVKNEHGRNTENLTVDEIPKEFTIEVFESKEYENTENSQFSRELLENFIKNEEFKNKIFNFINGAILIYPEILDHLPENITLKEEDFKIFEYLSKKSGELED